MNHIEVLNLSNKSSINTLSNFDPTLPSRYLIHGWNGDRNNEVNVFTLDALFNVSHNLNLITVEWKNCAKSDYSEVRGRLKSVGEVLGKFIDFVADHYPTQLNQTELIGHSFGAHVAAFAGKYLIAKQRIVAAIIGLDPAGPLFSEDKPNERLDKGDANYVEIIHTSIRAIGFPEPIGHVDHYPYVHSKHQPGCSDSTCDHNSAISYFVESVNQTNGILAKQCTNYTDLIEDQCHPTGVTVKVGGEPLNTQNPAGVYYFPI